LRIFPEKLSLIHQELCELLIFNQATGLGSQHIRLLSLQVPSNQGCGVGGKISDSDLSKISNSLL